MHLLYPDENNEMEKDNNNNMGHTIYDDFNSSGHNDPTTCATMILDSTDNTVICD